MKSMDTIAKTVWVLFWSGIFVWLFSAGMVLAQETGGTSDDSTPPSTLEFKLESPLKDIGGIDVLVERLLNDIVLPLGATFAALAIIYSGFLYVKAQGKPGEIEKAHEAIKWTIVGTAVILGAWALAQLIGGTIDLLRTTGGAETPSLALKTFEVHKALF